MSTLVSDHQGVLARCTACGKTNRLRFSNLGRATRCGSCRAMLPAPGEPVEAGDAATFRTMVAESALPVLVDFWAPWCGPCRMMAPELESAARQLTGKALVIKVNTDAVPELGEQFRIRSIPTLAVFRQGREISRVAGALPAVEIEALVGRA